MKKYKNPQLVILITSVGLAITLILIGEFRRSLGMDGMSLGLNSIIVASILVVLAGILLLVSSRQRWRMTVFAIMLGAGVAMYARAIYWVGGY